MKVCSQPGCGELVARSGPCTVHRTAARRQRGDPDGLHDHRLTRARLMRTAFGQPCPMCGEPMLPGQPLDLDHSVARALGGSGSGDRITHASCNRSAGGRLSAQLRTN